MSSYGCICFPLSGSVWLKHISLPSPLEKNKHCTRPGREARLTVSVTGSTSGFKAKRLRVTPPTSRDRLRAGLCHWPPTTGESFDVTQAVDLCDNRRFRVRSEFFMAGKTQEWTHKFRNFETPAAEAKCVSRLVERVLVTARRFSQYTNIARPPQDLSPATDDRRKLQLSSRFRHPICNCRIRFTAWFCNNNRKFTWNALICSLHSSLNRSLPNKLVTVT